MKKFAIFAVLVSAALAFQLAPVGAGQPGRTIDVTKDVVGDGPTTPYIFEVNCGGQETLEFDLVDGETFTISVATASTITCTVTETDDQGADDVAYECTEGSQGDEAAVCEDGNVVAWDSDFTGDADIIVTNTFDPEPTTTTTTAPSTSTTSAAVAPAAAAVVATPAFTG